MSAPARLAGFATALALVFAAALLAGGTFGPDRDGAAVADAGHGDEADAGAHGAMAPKAVRGLGVSHDGLTLEPARITARAGEPFSLRFRIAGRDGRTVRDFDVEHTKRMHLIVVRRDMTGFQHLHPAQRRDGTWSARVTLPDAGAYRLFADFSHADQPETLAGDVQVDGSVRSAPLPAPAAATTVDGLRVRLSAGTGHAGAESALGFTVTRDGRPVPVEDYLGAKGHLVALRQGDLAFLHVHPDADRLRFMATFPTAGAYRLFLQFKTGGDIHTAAFTRQVPR